MALVVHINKIYSFICYAIAICLILNNITNLWGEIIWLHSLSINTIALTLACILIIIYLFLKNKYAIIITAIYAYYGWLNVPMILPTPKTIYNMIFSSSEIYFQPVISLTIIQLLVLFSTIGVGILIYQKVLNKTGFDERY